MRRNKRPEKYDDTNFAVLNALNYELTQAEQETIASKIQSSLESATDTYLDTWGDWFGVYRKDGWDDEYYRARIIRELLLKRGTIPAIIDALVDFLNDNDAVVQIYEPWRNIFYTNKSKLNGDDHLMGYYYRFAIIDISIDRPFPPEIVEIIKAFKPAGVLFYLRLDTSLAKNKTTVESPYVYLDVTNKTELAFLNGLYYDLRGNINLSDQRTQVVGNNIFHTNNSKLNGEDVLAGAFNHGRGYIHLASTTLLDYTPKATDSMSNLKTTLGEAGSDMYNQTKEKDGRTASIQVPATKNVHTLYSNSIDFGDYDYSTAPNLLKTVTRNHWSNWISSVSTPNNYVKVFDDYIIIDATDPSAVNVGRNVYIPNITRLTKGKQYTLSVSMMVDDEFDLGENSYNQSAVHYTVQSNGTPERPMIIRPNKTMVNQWQRVSVKFTVPTSIKDGDFCFLHFYEGSKVTGKWYIRNDIMIQEGDQTSSQAPANQMPKTTTDKWYLPTSMLKKVDEEGNVTRFEHPVNNAINHNVYLQNDINLIPLLPNQKQYTMSAEIWLEKEVNTQLVYRVNDKDGNYKILMVANSIGTVPAKQWTKVSTTQTINLPSNPNIANKSVAFPINSSVFNVYNGDMEEEFIIGQTYTITLKGTKPASQTFRAYNNSTVNFGNLKPVEGLTDVWSLTFTPTELDPDFPKNLRIYQFYKETLGACQIDWLKIEKGNTYTPDYPQHWFQINTAQDYSGIIKIKNDSIKIQEGAKTTKPAWKPNLLDAPYYLGKHEVNKNIANPDVVFPINTNAYKIYEGNILEDFSTAKTYTLSMKGTKSASQRFMAYIGGTQLLAQLSPVEGLVDVWSATFTPQNIPPAVPKLLQIYQVPADTVGAVHIDWVKLEISEYRTPNIDSYDYVGSLIEDTETPTLDPTKYTWTVNGDVTNKKAYMVFDIKTFIEENYATEFEKLVADLGEDQALNVVFENFNISTALKALVSPSSPINFSVELYDFSTSTWHKLNTDSLDLRMRTFNLVANRITDYLNDYKLLFVRYIFDNETDKDVTVELDMLNILFNYRLGDGYSLGLQSTVECLSEIPLKGLALSSESVELGVDETAKVTATPVPANATNKSLEWEIADPKIATIDSSGNITGVSVGTTTLTVYGEDRTISATCEVSIKVRHDLYSNSIDFGNYDYSGNPNLMRTLTFNDWDLMGKNITKSDVNGEYVSFDFSGEVTDMNVYAGFAKSLPALTTGKNYTLSAEVMTDVAWEGRIRMSYRINKPDGSPSPVAQGSLIGDVVNPEANKWYTLVTMDNNHTIPDVMDTCKSVWLQANLSNTNFKGKLNIKYTVKIEEGLVATPYQPNLLDAPYYLGTKAVNANIADPKKVFPIKTSAYNIYLGKNTEKYQANQTYTITMKATKPATQQFGVYLLGGAMGVGNMKPVEGLSDVWQLTFKVTQAHLDAGVTDVLSLYQVPNTSVGAVTIDWIKLEKGDTRTPNIDSYAYHGTVLTTSEEAPTDPNAYTWTGTLLRLTE